MVRRQALVYSLYGRQIKNVLVRPLVLLHVLSCRVWAYTRSEDPARIALAAQELDHAKPRQTA